MRTPLALLLAAGAVGAGLLVTAPALSSAPSSDASPVPRAQAAATRSVQVRDNFFRPRSLRVRRRDTVVFRWRGSNPHNVHAVSGPRRFESRIQRSGTYRRRLTRRGTYRIVCDVHPDMAMRLRVR